MWHCLCFLLLVTRSHRGRPIQQLTIGIESLDAEIRDKIEKFKETKTKTH